MLRGSLAARARAAPEDREAVAASSRYLIAAVVRVVLLATGCWFAFGTDALGPDTPLLSRVGLVVLAFVLSTVVGTMVEMRLHLGMLVGALKELRKSPEAVAHATEASEPRASKDRGAAEQPPGLAAVPILIAALDGRAGSGREAAHAHLQRITGQSLPANADAWRTWWAAQGKA